ncbi:MAG: uracil-DNA glycosylase family protein [Pseudomonadota bacterium]|nr:uracil-DNA glycosylase family protein [Pseudomonadota bacterium]
MSRSLPGLLREVRACRLCEAHLPLGPRPVLQAGAGARILVVGQAPGARVHASGVPWEDASGDRLRAWMGIDKTVFHDPRQIALIPMGLCYPGRGNGGDLPPRPECAPQWMGRLLAALPQVELTLLIGLHAQRHLLGPRRQRTLTETVRHWQDYAPAYFPLPHPSPRNTPWFQAHPWLDVELLPALRERVHHLLQH